MPESRTHQSAQDNLPEESIGEIACSAPTTKPVEHFTDLLTNTALLQSLAALNFNTPTPIQAAAVPLLLQGRDAVLQAKTGSGKTLAFALPVAERCTAVADLGNATRALFVSPTRELANQISQVFQNVANISVVTVIGGADIQQQKAQLRDHPAIVVGTPGRILDLMRDRTLDLRKCSYYVLDEADEMLSMGFLEDVRAILSRVPSNCQGVFVSATITPRVEMLANSFLENPAWVRVDNPNEELPSIEHFYCQVPGELMAKPLVLCDIIETYRPQSAIVFCNTKSDTQLVEALLRRRGFDARRINSDLRQSQRDRIMRDIRNGSLRFLVATDIAARGLDLEHVELVVNYSIHEQPETYIHRTGRTGRAGRSGKAVSLVGPRDFGFFHHITKVLPIEFQKLEPPTDEEVASARVAHFHEILRNAEFTPTPRDMLVAQKFFTDISGEGTLSEETASVIAKLCHVTLDHLLQAKTQSLEEELEESSDDQRGNEESTSRNRSRRRSEHDRDEGNARSESDGPSENEARIYLSQGSAQGFTEESLRSFITDFSELHPEQLLGVAVKDRCSFITVPSDISEKLIAALHGIEYNGSTLTVEFADQYAPRRDSRNSRRNNSSDRRGRRRGRRSDH